MVEVSALLRRHERMRSQRETDVDTTWRECFDYTFPLRANGLSRAISTITGQQHKQAEMLDSTAADAASILAANIMGGLTPSNSLWFAIDVGNETNDERRWLDDSAKLLWENIHMANFDAEGYECCLDIVPAGMFALYVDEDRENGGFAFQQWPLAQCYFASTKADGSIDIVHRLYKLTAEQAQTEFGDDKLPDPITKALQDGKYSEEFEFLHVIEPRRTSVVNPRLSKNLPVASYHIALCTKSVVREAGYHEMPVIVPRWLRVSGSIYAVGPMYAALPDVRQINQLKALELANADIAVGGMWIGVDDGILNPRNLRLGARKVVIAADTDNLKALETGADFALSDAMVTKLQESIRRTLMADILPAVDGPTKTAFEYSARIDQARKVRAPVYGRLQAEYLGPLVVRCFGLALRAGVFSPPPPSLRDRNYSVRYVSPLARAQKLDEVNAIQGTLQFAAGLIDLEPQIMDEIDAREAVKLTAQGLGAPGTLLRSPQEVAKRRQAKAEAQQQAQQQQMAAQAQQVGMDAAAERSAVA